jgi:hypothetical protein
VAEIDTSSQELNKALHFAEDRWEIERERRLRAESDLIAMEIRCAAALDAMASVMAAPEYRMGKRLRRVLKRD